MKEVLAAKKCFHCGDECFEEIHFEDKNFCCHGCKAVYELIQASDLSQYYGNKELKTTKISDKLAVERKFGFLEHPQVVEELLRFRDEKRSIITFYIASIHCSSCIYLLEHLPKLEPDILRSEVNFIRKEVTITFDHHRLNLKEIAILLASLGYEPSINLDSLDKTKKVVRKDSIGAKVAVAGFCFGNSMLISLPEYLDTGFQLDQSFKSLFGWINLLLMIPVVLYSARDYFISAWKGLKHSHLNIDVPIAMGILTLTLRSSYEIIWHMGPGYIDSLTGLVFFLLIGKWYQGKSYEALSFERDFTSYFPISVTVLQDGSETNVMIKDLKPGDEILIHHQELIPADGKIIAGVGNLDYSFVTGESELVSKSVDDKVFAGGRHTGGPIRIRLSKTVNNSELTQLWNLNTQNENEKNGYDTLIDRVSKYFTLTIIILAVGTGIYWGLNDPEKVWSSVTAVLIIACPCALALALPFSYGHAMRILGKSGVYLKEANVIESLSRIRQVVFDKTGTLTQCTPDDLLFEGKNLTLQQKSLIKTAAANSAHPYSKLIARSFGYEIGKQPITQFKEEVSKGLIAKVDGFEVKIGSAQWAGVDSSQPNESRVYIVINNEILGYFLIKATYREGIFDCLKVLRSKFQLHLLTGDTTTEKSRLSTYFDHMSFDQKPVDKLEYITRSKANTLMVGDGLNDAGALKSATVGFAVSEDIHQFSPSSDAILSTPAVLKIPEILSFSKSVVRILIAAFVISFLYNITGLSFAVSGNLSPIISAILMPISSVTVVGFITLAVNLAGFKLRTVR